ncbi:MAG: hypothetical protein ACI9WS_001423, partial [Paraglaciecola psychrophila]
TTGYGTTHLKIHEGTRRPAPPLKKMESGISLLHDSLKATQRDSFVVW